MIIIQSESAAAEKSWLKPKEIVPTKWLQD